MANQARFAIAQSVTILGFFIASILLIALVAAASTQSFVGFPATHALTQAYYYAIWAAAIYFAVTVLMIMTVWGALTGKYERQFSLTTSQRTLMLQTISFMVYLLIGALIFSRVEGWKYLDAVYWADFTLLTIGIGTPFTPQTHTGRALLFPYAVGGIVTVGLVVSSIRSMLLESGREKMRARATEKSRQKVQSLANAAKDVSIPVPDNIKSSEPSKLPEKDRRRLEFHVMRRIQDKAIRRSRWNSLFMSTCAGFILWLVGAVVFMKTEYKQDWSYFVSLYFSFTTLLTIGYGDFQPLSNSGRSFFVLWSLLAVPTLTTLISDMSDTVLEGLKELTNWIGALTILPGESGVAKAWKQSLNTFTGRAWIQPRSSKLREHARDALGTTKRYDQQEAKRHGNVTRMLRARLEDQDIADCQDHYNLGPGEDSIERDRHFYRWILTKEVGHVISDGKEDSEKRYTYDEWSYFLLLLGHREDNPEVHQNPDTAPEIPDKEFEQGPVLGQIMDPDGNPHSWSWMGIRSPLMSPKEETDWILQQLIAKLQRELNLQSALVERQRRDKPPVSLSLLQEIDVDGSKLTRPRRTRQ